MCGKFYIGQKDGPVKIALVARFGCFARNDSRTSYQGLNCFHWSRRHQTVVFTFCFVTLTFASTMRVVHLGYVRCAMPVSIQWLIPTG